MSWKREDNFGVIDIGSNTVRGVVYYGEKLKTIDGSIAFKSNILEETSEGVLSYNGIKLLIDQIKQTLEYFAKRGAKRAYAFATSAMRDVTNFDEVYSVIRRKTGVEIELISGDMEAEYDYLALSEISGVRGGIGVDLGGGSAQVVVFDEGGVLKAKSFPIGVKRIRNTFCKDILPADAELLEIGEHIKEMLSGIEAENREVWFMGGTAKAVFRAAESVLLKKEVTASDLTELYNLMKADTAALKKIFGKRYVTMPVGVQVMRMIAENFGAERIMVSDAGVRDGYVAALFKKKGSRKDD